jgi:hypothetical protein
MKYNAQGEDQFESAFAGVNNNWLDHTCAHSNSCRRRGISDAGLGIQEATTFFSPMNHQLHLDI